MENSQCFSHVTTRARHHKKSASKQNNIFAKI